MLNRKHILLYERGVVMKVSIEYVPKESQEEVIIRCHSVNETIHNILRLLEAPQERLIGQVNEEIHILEPEKIFYIESVDRKTFIYGMQQVYESHKKLYELEEELESHLFFRCSKSMILNINRIHSVRPMFDGRFEALLDNREKVYISRKYVPILKQKLGIGRRD